jgi:hypothetical protein
VDVTYEVANLGLSFGTALTRSGIFRVTESFVMEALTHPDVNARFVATDSYVSDVQLARYDRSVNGRLGERRVDAWDSGVSSLEASIDLVDRLMSSAERDPATARLRAEVALLNRMARPRSIAGPVDIYHSIRQPLASPDRVPARVRIATIHDMVPSLFPEVTEERFVALHDAVLRSIDVERDWVMCISESTRRDFISVTGMAEERTFVVPLAASPQVFRPEEDEVRLASVLARYSTQPVYARAAKEPGAAREGVRRRCRELVAARSAPRACRRTRMEVGIPDGDRPKHWASGQAARSARPRA